MLDYHIHPNYSIDAEGAVEQFCDVALSKGLGEIAFTTHVDADRKSGDHFVMVNGKRVDVKDGRWLEDYEVKVRETGDIFFQRGLRVLLGVELDCFSGVEEQLPERFFRTDFDIILGAVHLIDHMAISAAGGAKRAFERYSLGELGSIYFQAVLEAVDCGHIDILAHLDLYRRFGEKFYGEKLRDLWKDHIDDLASKMKKRGVGFEINTSPWRRGHKDPMPAPDFASALVERGISNVTIGSDAHTPEDVGKGIDTAIGHLKGLGLDSVTRYARRQSNQVSI